MKQHRSASNQLKNSPFPIFADSHHRFRDSEDHVAYQTHERHLSTYNGNLATCRDLVLVGLTHLVRFGGASAHRKGTRKRTGILTTFETCSGPRDIDVRPCCTFDADGGSCSRLELPFVAVGADL